MDENEETDGRLGMLAQEILSAHDRALTEMKAAIEDESDYAAHIVAAARLSLASGLMREAVDLNAFE